MTRVSFMIPGKPRGKQRHRSTRGGRTYTPAATVAAEKEIATLYRLAARSAPVMTGTVVLAIMAVFPIPKGWSRRLRAAALAGEVEFTGKPDRDNIEKLVSDALNGVAFVDDAQISRGPVIRRYGEPARTEVLIEERKAEGRLKTPQERRREAKLASGVPLRPKRKRRALGPLAASELLAIGKRIR